MRDFIYIFYLKLKNILITHLMVYLLHLLVFLTNTLHSKRYVSGNQKDFMNKELSKAVIVSSKLWNRFLRLKTEKLNCLCKKTVILLICYVQKRRLLWQIKYEFYDWRQVFWKNVCSLSSNKKLYKSLINTLLEKEEIVKNGNKYFFQQYNKNTKYWKELMYYM